ncbi:MAG TPA: hypothetical protein VF937_05840, partial [Chloroflexota bacterium]
WRYVNGGHYGGEGSECGYNSSGVVAAVGADVAGVGPGDRVFTPQPHADYQAGDNVVVVGQGIVGVLAAQVAQMVGARVVALEVDRSAPPDDIARALLRATFMDRDRFHNQRVRIIACSNDPGAEYPPTAVRWTIQRNMQYIAAQIAEGALKPSQAITHRFQWDELPAVYERFVAGDRSMVGVTLHWS